MKNVIFDLGGVVFNWDSEQLINISFSNPEDKSRVKEHFVSHPRWAELDRGVKDIDQIIEEASQSSGLEKKVLRNMLDRALEFLKPKEQTIEIIGQLKKRNYKLFVLSNMPHETWKHLKKTYPVFPLFDGLVASCDVGMIKPEAEIYQYILNKFNLIPQETLFIDDMKENIEAAKVQGINGIVFESPEKLEKQLKEMGCL